MGNATSTPGVDPADAEVRRSHARRSQRARVEHWSPRLGTARRCPPGRSDELTRAVPPSDPQKTPSPGHQLSFDIAYEVVKHADVQDAARAACACKSLYALRDADQLWWRPSCEALGAQARLYVPRAASGGPIHGGTWKEHFFHLWAARDRWAEPAPSEAEFVRERFRRLLEDGDGVGLVGADDDGSDSAPPDASAADTSFPSAPGPAPGPARVGGVQVEHGSVKVSVRMRPRGAGAARADGEARRGAVVLPLHQRLRIIKAQKGEGCTTSDAMRTLMRDSGREIEASRSPWADAEVVSDGSDGGSAEAEREAGVMRTQSRDAPRALKDVTNDEKERNDKRHHLAKEDSAPPSRSDPAAGFEFACGVLSIDEREGRVLAVAPGVGLREFAFDAVFGESATQAEVYEKSARPLVADFLNGFNGAMLVYGQTGSGKTHTMFGTDADDALGSAETAGIVPRACEEILNAVRWRSTEAGGGISWSLAASYVEVYGQDVFDLLAGGARVGQSRVASRRYVADGDTSVDVRTAEDIARVLKTGDAQKRRAATAMNDRSSRAHAVFSLTLMQTMDTSVEKKKENGAPSISARQLRSRLCLVDLGGSEKLTKSCANEGARGAGTVPWAEYYASRARMTEATNINVGLLALKRCVDALHEAQRRRREGIEPPPHVPYSDSKLTELLSDALGGDGKTAVLVACAPEHEHAVETAQSLRFGETCASVETRARVGRDALAGALALLNEKIEDCEARIKLSERWVTTTTTRRDEIDGTEERVVVSKLAGAEGLRVELEAMLAERAFLANRIAGASR